MANGYKEPSEITLLNFSIDSIAQLQRLDLIFSKDIDNFSIPKHLNFWIGEGAILHNLRGAQRITTMNKYDLFGKFS